MTVSISQSKVIYTGNGETTQWDIPFPFLSKNDLKVYLKGTLGDLTLLTNQYSVDEDSAVLTYPVAGNGVPVLDSTQKLIILRSTPRTQETDLAAQATIDPDTLEGNDDKAMLVCQELTEEIGRCLKFPVTSSPTDESISTYLADITDTVSTVQQAAEQAREYATLAQTTVTNKLSKTGDTMTGVLQIQSLAGTHLKLSDTELDRDIAPETDKTGDFIDLNDKNDDTMGRILLLNNANGDNGIQMEAASANNTEKVTIGAVINSTGTSSYAFCPTPASDSNTNHIATTAWVRGYGADQSLSNISNAGKIVAAKASMPSASYDDVTFSASGTTYTAPSDGWYYLCISVGGLSNHWVNITYNSWYVGNHWGEVANGTFALPPYPVKKGDTIKIDYGTGITGASKFRFYYAEGSKSEKAS